MTRTDWHVHVGIRGDHWPHWGGFSDDYMNTFVFKSFLLFARMDQTQVTDPILFEKTVEVIAQSSLERVVCLALDPPYDSDGTPRRDLAYLWIDNGFITDKLRPALQEKILFGASVHPYDADFHKRVRCCVEQDAVVMKWLPSGQRIDLADPRTGEAMKFLAKVRQGRPLPLLLHVGPEYAVLSRDEKTNGFNCLSWSWKDRLLNVFRKWQKPRLKSVHDNLRAALDAGAEIIFAHCGLPYYGSIPVLGTFEHSDFAVIRDYLARSRDGAFKGRCYADVSSICTPFRKKFFPEIAMLPPESVLFGSDFPTPIFELNSDLDEILRDLKAILNGDFARFVVSQDNLLDVNARELERFFPGHPMFSNAPAISVQENIT